MSVEIKRYNIEMTRGDTLILPIEICFADENGDLHEYEFEEGDEISFALKKDYNDEEILIEKDIPCDNPILILNPEDTKKLDQPDVYVYDIQITLNDGYVTTIIGKKQKAKLKIIEEVA